MPQTVFVSATPGPYELEKSGGDVVQQVVRPTGLLDPEVEVRPVSTQVDDLLSEIRKRVAVEERVLVTTLTKRMAEDLTEYLADHEVRVRYLHSDIDTVERVEIIRDLRLGKFDVLVGINLLREGLDMPEVSLVAILDADKEGFLRSTRSLIQTIGRAARNLNGKVILYGDTITNSMKVAIEETERRRALQHAHNLEHGIVPKGLNKAIGDVMDMGAAARRARRARESQGCRTARGVPCPLCQRDQQGDQADGRADVPACAGSGVRTGGGAAGSDPAAARRADRVMSTRRWLIWRRLRRLYQGFRHPGTPWWAKGLVILILLYGISPVDVVPDVVPLLGWLDDATLLLLLLWGWEKCLPGEVLAALDKAE